MVRTRIINIVLLLLALTSSLRCFGEGFGSTDFNAYGNFVLRAGAQKNDSALNYISVGRYWTGTQYKGLIASYLKSSGGQDFSFSATGTTPSRLLVDLAGAGLDTLCNAVVYTYDGFITACRSMESNGYYDTYLAKFTNAGVLDSSFGTNGIKKTSLGGNSTSGNAYVRGIIYDANTGTGGHNGTVVITGSIGKSSPGFVPFIAAFDQQTGAQYGTTTTIAGLSGTAVAIAFDSANSKYYTASTETASGNRKFYVHQFNTSLVKASSPWGVAVDMTTAISGGAADSVPSGIAVIGSNVITVGGNRASTSDPWRCAVTSHVAATGNLNTSFGTVNSPLTGGTANQGITLFTQNVARDCMLNGITAPPSGTTISSVGSVYNGSNYDYLSAQMDSSGAMNGSFGTNGIKSQTGGSADDVHNFMLWLDSSTSSFYGIGRSQNNSLVNGGALSKVAANTGSFTTVTINTWTAMNTTNAAGSVKLVACHTWNGTQLIVWGGYLWSTPTNTGSKYDPVANTWTVITTTGAPSARGFPSCTWTESKLMVYGGDDTNDGALYDPVGNSWTAMTTTGAPNSRYYMGTPGLWTGTEVIIWGGAAIGNTERRGGKYNPSTNTWTAMTTTNAPTGDATSRLLTVWTGSKMLAYGGSAWGGPVITGGLYDPSTNTWTQTATTGALSTAYNHGVWTGQKLFVWGGTPDGGSTRVNMGALYNPTTNSWASSTTTGAPSPRSYHGMTWTGSKAVVWGGTDGSVNLNTGGFYDPFNNSWTTMTTTGAPDIRKYDYGTAHGVIWSGSRLLIYGGYAAEGSFYTP